MVVGDQWLDQRSGGLNRFAAGFSGANADAVIHRQDKDLSVADLTGLARAAAFDDGVDRWLDELFIDCDLKLKLAQKIDAEFVTSVWTSLSALAGESLAIHHR